MVNWERYDNKIDIWSVGCVMAELLRHTPLFPGRDYLDVVPNIIRVIGTPTEQELNELCTPRMFLPLLTYRFIGHEPSELTFSGTSVYPERIIKRSSCRLSCLVSHFIRGW